MSALRYSLSNGKNTSDLSQAQTWAQADSIKTGSSIVIIDNQAWSGLGAIIAIAKAGQIQTVNS